MSSSTSEFPPVAKLCSNCQKAQFQDDVPQLFQAGSHLEFDQEHEPPPRYCENTYYGEWAIIPTEFEFEDWFPELPKLVKSGQDGCEFCFFLHEAITFAASERGDISTSGHIFLTISYLWGPFQGEGLSSGKSPCTWSIGLNAMQITFEISCDEISSESIFTVDCSIQSLHDSDAISQWLRLDTLAYPSYCDADSICWMNQRLEVCQEEHDHDVFDKKYIPERLIDVSLETPRLTFRKDVLRSSHSSDFEYAALSYCWGLGEGQAKTTATTLYDRQAGISETEMPPVLQDAIQITRALSIPFLWIDALCILQDDQSDWEQQCGEMHKIYGSAKVTLCVANSRSCNEGFLHQTTPCVQLPFRSLRAPDIAGPFLVQYTGHQSDVPYRIWPPDFQSWELLLSDVRDSRWRKRGWVFQEDKLSTRKLVFGRCNIYFVCDDIEHARGRGYPSEEKGPRIGKSLASKDSNDIYEDWDTNVLFYYSRYDASTFSCAADVLPALSGLARLFGNRLKDFYYAGHWERDLYRSLSWQGTIYQSLPVQSPGIIIPSWSRLAKGYTETYVYHSPETGLDLRSEITVSKARVITIGDNPFGALKECRLWIRGYTLDMSRRELQVSGQPNLGLFLGQWHMVVYGCCFGHLEFDWQTGLDDPGKACPSREDVKELKLLLLGSFEGYISEGVAGGEGSERFSIHDDQDSAPKERSSDESESLDRNEESCEGICSQEQTNDQEISTLGDDGSGYGQFQVPIRQGYGLIISPTGNDGEFRRVGFITARKTRRGSHKCAPYGNGNLKALQSLAQMETVQLV